MAGALTLGSLRFGYTLRAGGGGGGAVVKASIWPRAAVYLRLTTPRAGPSSLALENLLQGRHTAVASVDLCLEADDGLISLMQPLGQCDHDVSLLQQKLLVAANLRFVLFDARPVPLQLLKFCDVL